MTFRKINDDRQLCLLDRLEGRKTFTTRVVRDQEAQAVEVREFWYLPSSWPDLVGGAWMID